MLWPVKFATNTSPLGGPLCKCVQVCATVCECVCNFTFLSFKYILSSLFIGRPSLFPLGQLFGLAAGPKLPPPFALPVGKCKIVPAQHGSRAKLFHSSIVHHFHSNSSSPFGQLSFPLLFSLPPSFSHLRKREAPIWSFFRIFPIFRIGSGWHPFDRLTRAHTSIWLLVICTSCSGCGSFFVCLLFFHHHLSCSLFARSHYLTLVLQLFLPDLRARLLQIQLERHDARFIQGQEFLCSVVVGRRFGDQLLEKCCSFGMLLVETDSQTGG